MIVIRRQRLQMDCPLLLVWLVCAFHMPPCLAQDDTWTVRGHAKYQFMFTSVPQDSVLRAVGGDQLVDNHLETRLSLTARSRQWDFKAHPQVIAVHSGSLKSYRELAGGTLIGSTVINDDRRWLNLTHDLHNEGKSALLLRLDRFNAGYIGDKVVVRLGRQAISWGNGLLFTPMDILNPFDPAAVDKEYKSGDDMLYGQYLLDSGSDVQSVAVVRRDPYSGNVTADQSSLAVKYHGFVGNREYDLLAARHYGDDLLGLGFSTGIGGAVWRGDLVWTKTGNGNTWSGVAGASYSGVFKGKNWSAFLEYFYNGFGQAPSDYSPLELSANPELLSRLARGELFNLGRHYLGASVTLELSPLLTLTPNMFVNLADPSALAQLVVAYSWKQDLNLLAALNVPLGPDGSEYGGIESSGPGEFVSTGPSVFMQLAWYF